MIEARGVSLAFGGRRIVDRVSLQVPKGQILGLVGPNGSGKTTLLRSLYGALVPASGTVWLDGENIARLPRRQIARRIGVVPQEQPAVSGLSLMDMVLLGRMPHRIGLGAFLSGARKADSESARAAIARVGLTERSVQSFASLSGGEAQRGLIARALSQEADHLLLDEPTNHLDLSYQHEILSLVRDLELTVVIVLHDLNLAARYCDQIALLHQGRLVACGAPAAVLNGAILEPVYQVSATRINRASGIVHLIFAETDTAI